jgi:hypothetical protein
MKITILDMEFWCLVGHLEADNERTHQHRAEFCIGVDLLFYIMLNKL